MATALKSKPGLTSTTALSIPDEWSSSWFRGFISNMLKGADVRNAVGANGITVSGTIASPYATISIGGSGPVTIPGPVVINSTAGQVSLTVNGASGQVAETINNGPLYIAPTGVNQIVLGATGANYGAIINTAAQTWALGYSSTLVGTGTAVLSWDAANGVTIAAPSGAVPALTVNANASDTAFQIQTTASNSAYGAYSIGGTVKGYLGFAGVANALVTGAAAGDLAIRTQGGAIDFSANGGTSVQMQLTTAGGVTINAPSSGTGLKVLGSMLVGSPTGGDQGTGTINATGLYVNGVSVGNVAQTTGTFTGTLVGCTTSPTATFSYVIVGKIAYVYPQTALTGTSNAVTMSVTGMPAALEPTNTVAGIVGVENAGTFPAGNFSVSNGSTTITFGVGTPGNGSSNFTNTGTKGLPAGVIMSWPLN